MTNLIGLGPHVDDTAASATDDATVEDPGYKVPGRRRRRDIGAALGTGWITLVVLLAVTAGWLPLPDPNFLSDQIAAAPGSHGHLLGTDSLGRDTLSRAIFGARVSIAVAVGGTGISLVIGVVLGMVAGYARGAVDTVTSMVINFVLAFPPLIFLIALVAAMGPSLKTMVVGLAVIAVPNFARVARANTIAFSHREFVVAAKALGAGPVRIMTRQLLANVMLPITSLALVVMAALVVAEGSLSYLGLGVPPPTPSWGGMLAEGQDAIRTHPHLVLIPGLFFFLTVFAFNRLGDWARRRVGRESAI